VCRNEPLGHTDTLCCAILSVSIQGVIFCCCLTNGSHSFKENIDVIGIVESGLSHFFFPILSEGNLSRLTNGVLGVLLKFSLLFHFSPLDAFSQQMRFVRPADLVPAAM